MASIGETRATFSAGYKPAKSPSDKVFIESLDREFNVAGILDRTYGQDDGFYFLPMATAQKLFKKENKLTAIGVQLYDPLQLQHVKDRLETMPDVYVVSAEQMSGEIMRFIGGTKALMYSVLIIALIVSAIGILNTVLMNNVAAATATPSTVNNVRVLCRFRFFCANDNKVI